MQFLSVQMVFLVYHSDMHLSCLIFVSLHFHYIRCWVHFSVNFCFLEATECVVVKSQLNFRAGKVELLALLFTQIV